MSGLKYIGGGAWIAGVPARDLSAEEAQQYIDLIEAAKIAGHVLYEELTTTTVKIVSTDHVVEKKGR